MATITPRVRKSGVSFQVKIRREGYPPLSQTFSSHASAEAWARNKEAEIDAAMTLGQDRLQRLGILGQSLGMSLDHILSLAVDEFLAHRHPL